MATLYYGGGDCTVEGNVGSLIIGYRGAIVVKDKLPNNYTITLEVGKLIIDSSAKLQSLNELFKYAGEFKISSATGKDIEGEKIYLTIKRVMDYSELLNTKAEELTVKSEDLKVTYLHRRTFRRTRILPKKLKGGKA